MGCCYSMVHSCHPLWSALSIKTKAKYAIINLRYTEETKAIFFAKEIMIIKIASQDKLFDSLSAFYNVYAGWCCKRRGCRCPHTERLFNDLRTLRWCFFKRSIFYLLFENWQINGGRRSKILFFHHSRVEKWNGDERYSSMLINEEKS